ncbi:DUF2243 domain-containing protein [Williamsia muralis]|uniref:DUF2243 domain-containing protein n=1 Tax=Williamsia marianensis TaxID=85044 RepID=UPI003F5CD3B1
MEESPTTAGGDGKSHLRSAQVAESAPRPSITSGVVLGIAFMAAVDEIVFHQLLAWHHFFDRSTPAIGLLSDGLLHTAEVLLLVAGFVLYADLRRRRALAGRHFTAGIFLGLGGFQLFDGIIDHKVLRTHQVRYDVDLLLYDLAWNAAGLLLVLIGTGLMVRARRSPLRTTTSDASP